MIEVDPDQVIGDLLESLAPSTRRVVIDDIAGLARQLGERARPFLIALTNQLYAAGVTTMFLMEIEPFAGLRPDLTATPLSPIADNVMVVQQVSAMGALHRVLAVLKMRFSDYDRTLREVVLDREGARVLRADESSPGVLAAAAEASGGFAPADPGPGNGGRGKRRNQSRKE